jgi:excisionase family DNA binding protein
MSTLHTVRAAADRLGVGYSTLKQWIYDGAVRTVRTRGGHHRLTELELQRLLTGGSPQKGPPAAGSARTAPAGGSSKGLASSPGGSPVLISGRNQLRGIVEEVRGDGLLAQVRIESGSAADGDHHAGRRQLKSEAWRQALAIIVDRGEIARRRGWPASHR